MSTVRVARESDLQFLDITLASADPAFEGGEHECLRTSEPLAISRASEHPLIPTYSTFCVALIRVEGQVVYG